MRFLSFLGAKVPLDWGKTVICIETYSLFNWKQTSKIRIIAFLALMNLKENETSLINMYFSCHNIGIFLDDELFSK